MAISSDDKALFQALKKRENAALAQLYDCYGDMMYSLALRILGNRQEAEDLIQEVFLSLWQNCRYNPERGTFKTFLMLLVRSRAIDRLRSQKTNFKVLERSGTQIKTEKPSKSPLEGAISDEISQRVQQALADLPDKQRQALEMSYFDGLSQLEISQQLEIPIGTVKSWFRLGFNKLRQSLNDFISDR